MRNVKRQRAQPCQSTARWSIPSAAGCRWPRSPPSRRRHLVDVTLSAPAPVQLRELLRGCWHFRWLFSSDALYQLRVASCCSVPEEMAETVDDVGRNAVTLARADRPLIVDIENWAIHLKQKRGQLSGTVPTQRGNGSFTAPATPFAFSSCFSGYFQPLQPDTLSAIAEPKNHHPQPLNPSWEESSQEGFCAWASMSGDARA